MAYTGVQVFGDSLVDAGNALKLAQFYGSLPFTSLPDGAPTAAEGYFAGRFSNGYTFADLISVKFVGVPTKPVFPYGYEDPWLGIADPFASEPHGINLNWAYGGAQIVKGAEAVPNFDGQTDAYKDAVDNQADPNALHLVTIGGNDVRSLVQATGAIPSEATATAVLQDAAAELAQELGQLIGIGVQHILVTGIPDVGIIPFYNGLPDEAARRAAATHYSEMLDGMIQAQLAQLQAANPTVEIRYVSLTDATADILANLEQLYGPDAIFPLNESHLLFFDAIHPTAQAHALLAASILDAINPLGPAGDVLPALHPTMVLAGSIAAAGEVDSYTVALIAGHGYTFDLRGVSSGGGSLPDPIVSLIDPNGTLIVQNDDAGLGLDAHFQFTAATTGVYTLKLGAVGTLTGSYALDVISPDSAGDSTYTVTDPARLIIEGVGQGYDRVLAGVSYALNPSAEVELLATTNDAGTAAINLTGNEFSQRIVGNAGSNILSGGDGADTLVGLGGDDIYRIVDLADTIVEASGGGNDRVEATISYTLGANIEQLTLLGTAPLNATGNALNNALTGNSANNVLDGGGGIDTMSGGTGNDTYVVDNGADAIVEPTGGGTDLVQASAGYTLPSNLENLTLTGTASVNATGNALANSLVGNAGNNVLSGMGGADSMAGGAGNDTYVVDVSGDRIAEAANGGVDLVQSSISYILGLELENLTLTGSGAINGTGNALANVLIGNAAANTLDGAAGADTMDGGQGNDTYIVDTIGDVVAETALGGGIDTVQASATFTLGANIENLTLLGTASINGTGNALANTILGTSGANQLSGLDGNDTIHGGKGADRLTGGLGSDTLKGGDGGDFFIFDTALGSSNVDTLIEYSPSDDTIWLDQTIFAALAAGGLASSAFRVGTTALDADDRIIYDKPNGNLYYDADGNGAGAAVLFAHLAGGTGLTSADLFIVP